MSAGCLSLAFFKQGEDDLCDSIGINLAILELRQLVDRTAPAEIGAKALSRSSAEEGAGDAPTQPAAAAQSADSFLEEGHKQVELARASGAVRGPVSRHPASVAPQQLVDSHKRRTAQDRMELVRETIGRCPVRDKEIATDDVAPHIGYLQSRLGRLVIRRQ
jgi:hypothetical protein